MYCKRWVVNAIWHAWSSSWMLKNVVAPWYSMKSWIMLEELPRQKILNHHLSALFCMYCRILPALVPLVTITSSMSMGECGGIVLWTCQKEGRSCGSSQCYPPSGSCRWSGQIFIAVWNASLAQYRPLVRSVTHRPSNLPEREIQTHPCTTKLTKNPQFQQLWCWQMPRAADVQLCAQSSGQWKASWNMQRASGLTLEL